MRTPARILLPILAVAAGLAASTGTASANFNLQLSGQTLTVTGDGGADKVTIRDKAGDPSTLEVDVAGDGSADLDAPRAQVKFIQIFGQEGNDEIRFDTRNGPVTSGASTEVFGGGGSDTIVGGDGREQIFGGPGFDDITGGPGADVVDAGADADTVLWFPGDGNDSTLGGEGRDDFFMVGSDGPEHVAAASPGGQNVVRVTSDAGGLTTDLTDVELFTASLQGGDDSLTVASGLPSSFATSALGGPGKDTLTGGDGSESFSGGTDDDVIATGPGQDTANLAPGEGTDQIDTGSGNDTMRTVGSTGDDEIALERSGDGVGVNFTGQGGATVRGAETFLTEAGRGNDTVTGGDGVSRLVIDGDDGDDTIRGGTEADDLRGDGGVDRVVGGGGNDLVDGGAGTDSLAGGAGSDKFFCGRPDTDTIDDLGSEDSLDKECDAPHARIETPQQPPEPSAPHGEPGQAAPGQPGAPGLPAGFLGFGKPKVKASVKALSVTVRNTHNQAITVRISGSERDGLKKAATFKALTRTIPAGGKVTFKLATPKKLRSRLAATVGRRGRAVRKPALTLVNADSGAQLQVKPKLKLKGRSRR